MYKSVGFVQHLLLFLDYSGLIIYPAWLLGILLFKGSCLQNTNLSFLEQI